jgi:hypothetical protein
MKVEDLKAIHYKIRELIEGGKWNAAANYIKTIMQTGDVNKMKMVLIATQSLINHPEIKESRYKLYQRFNKEMGWVHKEWPLFKGKDPDVPESNKP